MKKIICKIFGHSIYSTDKYFISTLIIRCKRCDMEGLIKPRFEGQRSRMYDWGEWQDYLIDKATAIEMEQARMLKQREIDNFVNNIFIQDSERTYLN